MTDRNSKLPTSIKADNNPVDTLHTYTVENWYSVLNAATTAAALADATKTSVCAAATAAAESNTKMTDAITAVTNDTAITTPAGALAALKAVDVATVVEGSNFARTFFFDADGDNTVDTGETLSTIEKPAGSRHANSSRVKVEIRCGRDKSNIFSLSAVQIDYVKAPQFIRLTQEQLDSDEDISQVMEFPDYVNQEIVNELVNLVMRKTNDPALQAHIQMTQSIARPTGQSQPAAQA